MKFKSLLAICCLLLLCVGCQAVPDTNGEIIIGKAGAPVSSAEISRVGFVSGIPTSEDEEPVWIDSADSPGILYSCCEVAELNDVSTSLEVYWTLPDGTTTKSSALAVNQNMYFFSELDIIDSGAYTVHWSLYGKEETTAVIHVS